MANSSKSLRPGISFSRRITILLGLKGHHVKKVREDDKGIVVLLSKDGTGQRKG